MHPPYTLISAKASQEGIKCSKAKEWLRPYFPNIYCQCLKSTTRDILWHSRKFKDFFFPCVAAELCSFHLMYTRGFQTYNFVLQRGLDFVKMYHLKYECTLGGVKSTTIDIKVASVLQIWSVKWFYLLRLILKVSKSRNKIFEL